VAPRAKRASKAYAIEAPTTNTNVGKTRSGQTTNINGPIGYPDRVKTTLVYCDTLTITGTSQQYTYKGNSLYDPNYTGTGHQPFYYDQYIAVYQRYRVYAAKIYIRSLNGADNPLTVVCVPSSQIPTFLSLSQALESPRSVSTGPLPVNYYFRAEELCLNATTREILGLTPAQIYDADFAALYNADPVELWYYALYFGSASSVNVTVQIRIEFQCEFFDRAPVSLSFNEVSLLRDSNLGKVITSLSKDKESFASVAVCKTSRK
jgi:hypothetical protein